MGNKSDLTKENLGVRKPILRGLIGIFLVILGAISLWVIIDKQLPLSGGTIRHRVPTNEITNEIVPGVYEFKWVEESVILGDGGVILLFLTIPSFLGGVILCFMAYHALKKIKAKKS